MVYLSALTLDATPLSFPMAIEDADTVVLFYF